MDRICNPEKQTQLLHRAPMFGAKSINPAWSRHIYNYRIWPWYSDNPVIMLSSLLQGLAGIRQTAAGIRPDDVTFHFHGGKCDRWNGHPARLGSRGELQDHANELTNS